MKFIFSHLSLALFNISITCCTRRVRVRTPAPRRLMQRPISEEQSSKFLEISHPNPYYEQASQLDKTNCFHDISTKLGQLVNISGNSKWATLHKLIDGQNIQNISDLKNFIMNINAMPTAHCLGMTTVIFRQEIARCAGLDLNHTDEEIIEFLIQLFDGKHPRISDLYFPLKFRPLRYLRYMSYLLLFPLPVIHLHLMFFISMIIPKLNHLVLELTPISLSIENSIPSSMMNLPVYLIRSFMSGLLPVNFVFPRLIAPLVPIILSLLLFWVFIDKLHDFLLPNSTSNPLPTCIKYVPVPKRPVRHILKSLLLHNVLIYSYLIGDIWTKVQADCMGPTTMAEPLESHRVFALASHLSIEWSDFSSHISKNPCFVKDIVELNQEKQLVLFGIEQITRKNYPRTSTIAGKLLLWYIIPPPIFTFAHTVSKDTDSTQIPPYNDKDTAVEKSKLSRDSHFRKIKEILKSPTINNQAYRHLQVAMFGRERPDLSNLKFRIFSFLNAYVEESTGMYKDLIYFGLPDKTNIIVEMMFKDNVIASITGLISYTVPGMIKFENIHNTLIFTYFLDLLGSDPKNLALTLVFLASLYAGMWASTIVDQFISIRSTSVSTIITILLLLFHS